MFITTEIPNATIGGVECHARLGVKTEKILIGDELSIDGTRSWMGEANFGIAKPPEGAGPHAYHGPLYMNEEWVMAEGEVFITQETSLLKMTTTSSEWTEAIPARSPVVQVIGTGAPKILAA